METSSVLFLRKSQFEWKFAMVWMINWAHFMVILMSDCIKLCGFGIFFTRLALEILFLWLCVSTFSLWCAFDEVWLLKLIWWTFFVGFWWDLQFAVICYWWNLGGCEFYGCLSNLGGVCGMHWMKLLFGL